MSASPSVIGATSQTRTAPRGTIDRGWAYRLRRVRRKARALADGAWTWVDMGLRFWLAYTFGGYALAAWMRDGAGIESGLALVASGLLAAGLLTRLACVPLLVQAVNAAGAGAEALHCTALLFWFFVAGAGPIALDTLLRAGAANSALPGHALLSRVFDALTRFGRPAVLLFLRLALAAALVGFATVPALAPLVTWQVSGVTTTVPVLGWGLALLFASGVTTSPLALLLALWTLGHAVAGGGTTGDLYALSLLALLLLRGAGAWSIDELAVAGLAPSLRGASWNDAQLPHVVVVGAGFGGLATVEGLRDARCRITLVDRRNYHLFQPLLYQVATCGLSPADIATPIREIVRDQPNVRTILGRVTGVDVTARQVEIGTARLDYDVLVVATGARHAYFDNDHFEAVAPGLKKIDDATDIRRRLLLAFERAEQATDEAERAAQLTFVIVGGGPTGVEMAGAVAELARHGLAGEFRHLQPEQARVILVEGGPRLLAAFAEPLSAFTRQSLEALGVEVRTDARATAIDEAGVTLGDERIAARTVVWAAGVMASPAGKWLGAEQDRAGRAVVDAHLRLPGRDDVFVIGDTASARGPDDRPVPGIAPAAKQAGAHVARVIGARLCGEPAPAPFRYRHQGNLATIGRAAAVADVGGLQLTGALAWWFWGLVHVAFLAHARHRIAVSFQWAWAYLTWRKSTRLITGHEG